MLDGGGECALGSLVGVGEEDAAREREGEGLEFARTEIKRIREEFWTNVRVPGSADAYNPEVEKAGRVADFLEFAELFATATETVARSTFTRAVVTLPLESLATARDLAERETACCSFFTFTTSPVGGSAVMTIEVPEQYADVLTALTSLADSAR